jgi:pimeloyl-ACP methyl ester carboxylesterase
VEIVAGCAVERTGSGEPLVLLHGIGSRRQIWAPLLPGLTGVRDVVALDLPGFGEASGQPSAAGRFPAGSVGALADAVEAVCAALDLDRPHVAGNSMGGAVALELGRRGAARSVTAFSPAGFWGRGGLAWCRGLITGARGLGGAVPAGLVRTLAATPVARPLVFGPFSAHPRRTGPDALAADAAALVAASGYTDSLRAFARLSWAQALGPDGEGPGELARTPAVVAWGTRDLVLPYRPQAARARALLPAAVHLPLPSCGHIPFADDPQACLAALFRASAAA